MSSPPLRALLLVDDRTPLLQLRKPILASLGYSVITATNASTALAKLENCIIDAVLLEYKSDGLDAEATAFHIRQRFPTLPIILLSAYWCLPERLRWLVDECVMRNEPLKGWAHVFDEPYAHPEVGRKGKLKVKCALNYAQNSNQWPE
jgi:CheY-like chemotaxis protein